MDTSSNLHSLHLFMCMYLLKEPLASDRSPVYGLKESEISIYPSTSYTLESLHYLQLIISSYSVIHILLFKCEFICILSIPDPCTKIKGLIPCLFQPSLVSMLWTGINFLPLVAVVTWVHIANCSQGSSNKPTQQHLSHGMCFRDHPPFITAHTRSLVLAIHNTTGLIFSK